MNNFDETFLARWANGTLNADEKQAFEASEEYASYQKLLMASSRFKAPEYPKEEICTNIQQKIHRVGRVRKLIQHFSYGVAAAVLILLSVLFSNNSDTIVSTEFGDQLSVLLPDGSEVILNAKSTISYDEANWETERKIQLDGEAYFKVKKGSPFSVVSDQGTVRVLGTEFNVNTYPSYFEVKCYEGKVETLNILSESNILTKGKAQRTIGSSLQITWFFDTNETHWSQGQHTFDRTPFAQVIRALENQYGIQVENSEQFNNEMFTGRFTNDNIEAALKTVFNAMQIQYTFKDNTVILSKP
jgi:ferric-dicitrate binding protein FerR (iron transport regulator)